MAEQVPYYWYVILTNYSSYTPYIQMEAVKYFRNNFKTVTSERNFGLIPFYVMKIVLEEKVDTNEEGVCDSILTWLELNNVNPKEGFHLILETVKIHLLSNNYIGTKIVPYCGYLPNFYLMMVLHLQSDLIRKILQINKKHAIEKHTSDRLLFVRDGNKKQIHVDLYDMFDNSWKFLTPKITHVNFGSAVVGKHLFIIGGEENSISTNCVLAVNLFTGEIKKLNSLREKRCAMGVAVVKEYNYTAVYAIGGFKYDGKRIFILNSVERWDSLCRKWTFMTNMYHRRACATATVINNKIYIAGGYGIDSRGMEEYDTSTRIWKPLANMHENRNFCSITAHRGMIYAVGGSDLKKNAILSSVERYNFKTKSWEYITSLPHPLRGYCCSSANRLFFIPNDLKRSCMLEYVEGKGSWKHLVDVYSQNDYLALLNINVDLEGTALSHRVNFHKTN